MIILACFESEFRGKKFKSTGIHNIPDGTEYVCVGYGDNDSNGNPYIVGMKEGSVPGSTAKLQTVLFKNVEFVS